MRQRGQIVACLWGTTLLLCLALSTSLLCGCGETSDISGDSPWELCGSPQPSASIAFSDPLHGWLVTGTSRGLWQTVDGGRSWQLCPGRIQGAPTSGPDVLPGRIARLPFGFQVLCLDDSVLVRYQQGDVGSGRSAGVLLSKDCGATWRVCLRLKAGVPAGESIGQVIGSDAEHLWAVCSAGLTSSGEDSPWLLYSNNGGASWERLPQPAPIEGNPTRVASILSMLDEVHGWAVGSSRDKDYDKHYWLLTTSDGGRSWTRRGSFPDDATIAAEGMSVPDMRHAWAVCGRVSKPDETHGSLLWTRDGGRTWHPDHAFDGRGVEGVFFVNARRGWVMVYDAIAGGGHEFSIYGTSDGGLSWTKELSTDCAGPTGFWQFWRFGDRVFVGGGSEMYSRPLQPIPTP